MAEKRPQARGSSAARTIASSGDRVRAFKSARRHSWLVRSMKLVLPIGALLGVAGYAGSLYIGARLVPKGLEVGTPEIDTKNLTMRTPRYSGISKDGAKYVLRAREAVTDLKMSGPVRLNSIDGEIEQTTGVVTMLKATWGTYDSKSEVLELHEKIDIDGSTGMRARMTRATVYNKENRIVSHAPLTAENETSTIRARTMTLLTKQRQAAFKGDVEVQLKPTVKPDPVRDAAKAAARAKAGQIPGLAGNSGLPIDVRSEQLDVDDNAKTALFRRAVVAKQGEATLESRELDVIYEGRATLDGAPQPRPKTEGDLAAAEPQSKLKTIKARGNVIMTNKDDRATSEAMEYDAETERVVLGGGVKLASGAERQAEARDALFDQKADTILLTGDVLVTQGRNVLKGGRLFVDRRAGKTRLEAPPGSSPLNGRINAVFYQGEQKAGTIPKEKAVESAPASPFATTFKADPNAPIEIDAATMDVNDTVKTAIFKVNVVAKQGDFVVRTAELTAHYSGQGMAITNSPAIPKDAKDTKDKPAGQATQLRRIEARNQVVVTGKDGQTAKGDWANFDVGSNTVVIGGNVVVSQGRNIGTGTRFVIDMTTGVSKFEQEAAPGGSSAAVPKGGAAPVKGPAISAADSGTRPTCPAGMVCNSNPNRPALVLYPKEMKDTAKDKAKEQGADPAAVKKVPKRPKASSWDAVAQPKPGE